MPAVEGLADIGPAAAKAVDWPTPDMWIGISRSRAKRLLRERRTQWRERRAIGAPQQLSPCQSDSFTVC
jgi:hypothetical protein